MEPPGVVESIRREKVEQKRGKFFRNNVRTMKVYGFHLVPVLPLAKLQLA